ncbi:MAG: copper chaperone PCu(A)C [SAR324 cluster bacterium]|nr:copper chaperone PCu(A)C [SAR324 cluster bacterium]
MKYFALPLLVLSFLVTSTFAEDPHGAMQGMNHSMPAGHKMPAGHTMKTMPAATLKLGFNRTKAVHLNNFYAYPTIKSVPGSVYLHFENTAKKSDELLKITSKDVKTVELHETTMEKNGMMLMRQVKKLVLKSGETKPFVPGGSHIMLIGLKKNLKKGDTVDLTLQFKNAGKINIKVPVIRRSGKTPTHSMHH